ncbi:enoyl-CoA hydratase/isomerase family protein [Parvibaculum sp.]|jgi:enoyl-CoA hydratase|uniref:enoyl-CoA hydratase/isomerase family protein n=1 Tax=Parvibaculaceae TaxID=2813035 RepID=UPI0025F66F9A|nr:enoyl-CoA hydratase/isomerase family protein [Parvibaculum sp.]
MTSAAEAPVQTEMRDGVGIVALNRPDKFNCLSSVVMAGLDEALAMFEGDRKVRAVLLLARGKNFCTGADLDEVLDARRERGRLEAFITGGHRVLRRLEVSPLPIVAAVNGLCLAGGLELMMACDVVFAGQSAQMGCQHARYGLVPGWGGTQRLARIVGSRRALDLMFSGRWLKADEALAWGLVNHIVDDSALAGMAEAYCADLAKKNPGGLAAMKQLCRNGLDGSLQEGLDMERSAVVDALMGENVSEGLAAFRERREPLFR